MNLRKVGSIAGILVSFIFSAFLSSPVQANLSGQPNQAPFAGASRQDEFDPVVIYMFWGDGCPHCAAAKPFLERLAEENPSIELRFYEVWYDVENQKLMEKMTAAFGFEPRAVPTIFIGEKYWEGFNDVIQEEIGKAVQTCLASGACPDKGAGIVQVSPSKPTQAIIQIQTTVPTPTSTLPEQPAKTEEASLSGNEKKGPSIEDSGQSSAEKIVLPFIGTVELSSKSLWLSTLLISFVDGVNPCSIWVLTMLLAITLHTGSRKKIIIIGLVFLTVTAGIYALFIAGLFTMLTFINFVGWIQVVVALISLFFAAINIKDYFWYKEGLSLTISDEKKPGIYQKMRRVVDASQSMGGLIGATIVLAAGVSLVEFSCTAGFPVLWTNILVSQNVTGWTFVLLLLLYLIIYQLDEMVIFFTAVFSLRASKLEEKHGRVLKLIGGMLMLSLALVMLINPALMNNLSSSLYIFGAAFGATILVIVLHRYILPPMGIHIGSEMKDRKNTKKRH